MTLEEPTAPGAPFVEWTEREVPRFLIMLVAVAVAALSLVEWALVAIYLARGDAVPLLVLLWTPLFALVAAWGIWRTYWSEPRRVGWAIEGFHIDWGWRRIRVPWTEVEPAFLASRWNSFPVFYRRSRARARSYVLLTRNQARALLAHADEYGWRIDRRVARRLGLP